MSCGCAVALVTVNVNGLNVYGSAVIDGTDRDRLERICRYLLRGPAALGRHKQGRTGC